MLAPKIGLAPRLVLLLVVPTSGCSPDRSLPLETGDPLSSLETTTLALTGVTPSHALYSERVEVTLLGTNLLSPVVAVYIDTVAASTVTHVDAGTITAVFEGGGPQRVGSHTVTVHLAGGLRAELPHAFQWTFDQDPVVFVHGCPLPKDSRFGVSLGSVTNYVTSSYWHALYTDLQARDYPAPRWGAREEFVQHPFKHHATRPAPNNYLNVFVLSEDSRDPAHVETAPPAGEGGHCGSGLALARELSEYVDQVLKKTKAAKVDLVVNSGGALGARWFLHPAGYNGVARVRDVVFLAAMNHGTEVAVVPTAYNDTANWWSPNYDMAREGFPAYACAGQGKGNAGEPLKEASSADPRDLQELVNGCFAKPGRAGNGAVEIPHEHGGGASGVAYLNIYNALADELIEPVTSACLNQNFPGDCSDTNINVPVHAYAPGELPHSAIRLDPEVRALTVCHLRRRNPKQQAPVGRCEAEWFAAISRPPGS